MSIDTSVELNVFKKANLIEGEKRFVLDWSYYISMPTYCEICQKLIENEHSVRMWFEISRDVYSGCFDNHRKGITVCSKHDSHEIVDFARKTFNNIVLHDKKLSGCTKWEVKNYFCKNDMTILENIREKHLEEFGKFVSERFNHRYGSSYVTKKDIIRGKVSELQREYEGLLAEIMCLDIDEQLIKEKINNIFQKLRQCVPRIRGSKDTLNLVNSVGNFLQNVAVVRFLYLGEISKHSFFRKRLLNYAKKWCSERMIVQHQESKEISLEKKENFVFLPDSDNFLPTQKSILDTMMEPAVKSLSEHFKKSTMEPTVKLVDKNIVEQKPDMKKQILESIQKIENVLGDLKKMLLSCNIEVK